MYLIGFPLLIIPFVLYNIFVFIFGVADWNAEVTRVQIISGGEWKITPADLLIALSILLLFAEILKSARAGSRGLVDHMLSMLLFIGMIVEFLLVERAATSVFFLIMVTAFVDVLGGFTVAIRAARHRHRKRRPNQSLTLARIFPLIPAPPSGCRPLFLVFGGALVAQPVEALLQFVKLAPEFVDVGATAAARGLLAAFGILLAREGCEHGEGALKHFHVPAHLILQRAEATGAESLRDLFAHLFLLAGKRAHGDFQKAWDQRLHAVAVEPDQLPQESDRQEALAFLVLLLEDDLCQHRTGDVLAGLGVVNHKILALFDHDREVFQRHIGAGAGIIEPAVGVFLDGDRFSGFCHAADPPPYCCAA
jgi:hypothetical protein